MDSAKSVLRTSEARSYESSHLRAPNEPSMSLHSLEVEQNGTGSITLDNVKGSALRLRGAAAYVMKAGVRVETIWRSRGTNLSFKYLKKLVPYKL